MNRTWAAFLVAASLTSLGGCATMNPPPALPIARTDAGVLSGRAEDGTIAFRGIPFAAPPVGPLRWRSPQPVAPWHGLRSAAEFGSACPQGPLPPPFGVAGPQSEDCLTLNVWAPANAVRGARKPVMLWIHGGAFLFGSGSQPAYNAAALARKGVIVVTTNYRLGALGFLAHPALSAEQAGGALGNYGLEDQLAALKWVHRNIAAFGGDPNNVTLFGESAGGISVQALMTVSAARGLFAKAISQSGGGTAVFLRAGSGTPGDAQGNAWAQAAGLANASMDQLRGLSMTRILSTPYFSFPHLDGKLLTRSPGDAFDRGLEAPVPMIFGSNSFEASLPAFDERTVRMTLGAGYEPLAEAYQRQFESSDRASAELRGDFYFVAPTLFLARRHSAVAPTWHYRFDWLPASARGKLWGAPHGSELPYLFGTPAQAAMRWDEADAALSERIMDRWTRFARTGDPNDPDEAAWLRMDAASGATFLIGDRPGMIPPSPLTERIAKAAVEAAREQWRK